MKNKFNFKVILLTIVTVIMLLAILLYLVLYDNSASFDEYKQISDTDSFVQVGDSVYYVEDKNTTDIDTIEEYVSKLGYEALVTECSFDLEQDDPPTGDVLEYKDLGKFYHINMVGGESFYAVVKDNIVIKVNYY